MNLHVYNGEKFERGKLWYIIFSTVFIVSIILSIINENLIWAIILFFILGAYFYYGIIANQKTTIHIDNQFIRIDKITHPRNHYIGYCIEIEKETNKIKNIVLIDKKWYSIYTIKDKEENIKNFSKELSNYIPMVDWYNQSLLEKLIRILKL